MYRDRLDEIRKEKGLSLKHLSEGSGISIDTITRIIHPENPTKDSPKVSTLEEICRTLGVELWEIFYLGDKSLVALQAEINALKTERDTLLADNAVLKSKIEEYRGKIDLLKDEIIRVHYHYTKEEK